MIVALDLAEKAGIAWYDEYSNTFYVTEVIGTPTEQFYHLMTIANNDILVILIEDFLYFNYKKSVKTVKSLLNRISIFQHLIKNEFNITPIYLNLNSVRNKFFKGKNKKQTCQTYFCDLFQQDFTDNHTDALILIIYYLDIEIKKDLNIIII